MSGSNSSSGNRIPLFPIVLAGLVVLGAAAWITWTALRGSPHTAQIPNRTGVITNTQNPSADLPVQSVLLSLQSTPKGATVLVDRFRMGVTPFKNAPVTSGAARELRVELKGYQPFVKTMPFLQNRNISVALTKLAPPASSVVGTPGIVNLTFRGTSWVRIKDKTGKVLYEGIPKQGSSLPFPGPITVRAGQPDQISSTINGVIKEAIGSAEAATITLP